MATEFEPQNSYRTFFSEHIPLPSLLAAQQEAQKLVIPAERMGFPIVPGITIDPENCKDRDDAIFVRKLDEGRYQALITVASVGEFITEGSALDTVAKCKGYTTYRKSDVVDSMLPPELSQEKLSLLAGQLRPTLTIQINFSKDAQIETVDMLRTCYQSPGDFSYTDALGMLNKPGHEYNAMLTAAADLALKLNERRTKKQRAKYKPGNKFKIPTVHEIVGELMLVGNYALARYAREHNLPVIFRNHPDSHDDCPIPRELRRGGAYYSPINKGHEALSFDSYNQGTSSLRRWNDVHNTRTIARYLQGETPTCLPEQLMQDAIHLTRRERQGRQGIN